MSSITLIDFSLFLITGLMKLSDIFILLNVLNYFPNASQALKNEINLF